MQSRVLYSVRSAVPSKGAGGQLPPPENLRYIIPHLLTVLTDGCVNTVRYSLQRTSAPIASSIRARNQENTVGLHIVHAHPRASNYTKNVAYVVHVSGYILKSWEVYEIDQINR